jgi:hypothetical protein
MKAAGIGPAQGSGRTRTVGRGRASLTASSVLVSVERRTLAEDLWEYGEDELAHMPSPSMTSTLAVSAFLPAASALGRACDTAVSAIPDGDRPQKLHAKVAARKLRRRRRS